MTSRAWRNPQHGGDEDLSSGARAREHRQGHALARPGAVRVSVTRARYGRDLGWERAQSGA